MKEAKPKKTINVLTSCNNSRAEIVTVLIASLSKSMKKYYIDFYFMHANVENEKLRIISEYCDELENITFIEIRVADLEDFDRIRQIGGKPDFEQFFWFEAHKYLPETLDRVIYLDPFDTLVVRDISNFYFADFEDKFLLVAPEINAYSHMPQLYVEPAQNLFDRNKDLDTLKRIALGIFNSGSIVLNLVKFRNDSLSLNRCCDVMEWLKSYITDVSVGDQGLFSLCYGSNFTLVDTIYNFRFFVGGAKYFTKIAIIHFCGFSPKPYEYYFSEDQEERVIEYLSQSKDKYVMLNQYHRLYDHYLPYYRLWWEYCKDTPAYAEYHFAAQQTTTRKLFQLGWDTSGSCVYKKIDDLNIRSNLAIDKLNSLITNERKCGALLNDSNSKYKRFVVTRLGVNNVTEEWFDYHIDLFEVLTLPTLECNADAKTYFCIIVSELIPINSLVKLNRILNNSPARSCFRILKVLPGWNCRSGSQGFVFDVLADFVKEEVENSDWFLVHNLDSDDGLCDGYFNLVEDIVQEKFELHGEHRCVIRFTEGVSYNMRTQSLNEMFFNFSSNNCTIVTNKSQDAALAYALHFHRQAFFEIHNGYADYPVTNERYNWFYTLHAQSAYTARVVSKDLKNERTRPHEQQPGKEIVSHTLYTLFNIDKQKIGEFLDKYSQAYTSPHLSLDLSHSYLIDELKNARAQFDSTTKIYGQLLNYNDLIKSEYHALIREMKLRAGSYQKALIEFYQIENAINMNTLENKDDWRLYISNIQKNGDLLCFLAYSDIEISYGGIYQSDMIRYEISYESLLMGQRIGRRKGHWQTVTVTAHAGYTQINAMSWNLGLNMPGLNIVTMRKSKDDGDEPKFVDSICLDAKLIKREEAAEELSLGVLCHLDKVFDIRGFLTD